MCLVFHVNVIINLSRVIFSSTYYHYYLFLYNHKTTTIQLASVVYFLLRCCSSVVAVQIINVHMNILKHLLLVGMACFAVFSCIVSSCSTVVVFIEAS